MTEKKKTGRVLLWILLPVLIVILALGGFLLLRGSEAHTPITPANVFESWLQKKMQLPEEESGSETEAAILRQVSYEILSSTDTSVIMEIRSPDVGMLLDEMVAEGGSVESAVEALNRGDYRLMTTRLTVELDENGRPVDSFAFLDAMYGGLYTWFAQLEERLGAEA